MEPEVVKLLLEKQIKDLKDDKINGSTNIAKEGLRIFELAFNYHNDPEDLDYIKKIADRILATKPAMAALRNIIELAFRQLVINISKNIYEFSKDELIQRMNEASEKTKKIAYRNIFKSKNAKTIVTASYSSTVMRVMEYAKKNEEEFKILAAISKWEDRKYGLQIKEECDNLEIECELFDENNASDVIMNSDLVLIGADTLIEKGGVVNGIPSLQIAQSALTKKEFLVVAESFKKSQLTVHDEGYDFIPSNMISEIISDELFVFS